MCILHTFYTGNESTGTLYWQIILVRFQLAFRPQNPGILLVGMCMTTFSSTRYWLFHFFQCKVIHHSITRFTLYWRKVGCMSVKIQGENNSGY